MPISLQIAHGCFHSTMVRLSRAETIWPQSLEYLLLGALPKKYADPSVMKFCGLED